MSHTRNDHPAHWTPAQKAGYFVIHEYTDGLNKGPKAMAPNIGKTGKVLSNEADPDYLGAKLGLDTAILAELEAGSAEILHGHAQMLHHICFALPSPDLIVSDVELLMTFSDWQSSMGITCTHIRNALDPDGPHGSKVTIEEANRIEQAGHAHMSKFMEFMERVKELAE